MTAFAVDTSALIRYRCAGRLGRRAAQAFQQWEEGRTLLYVPAPVVQETCLLWKAGHLDQSTTPRLFWRSFESQSTVHEPMSGEDALSASDLAWDHRDPYDRLIVAVALRLELPLITSDSVIQDWGGIETIW